MGSVIEDSTSISLTEMVEDEGTKELSSLSSLEKDLHPEILKHIFSFVGGHEYRFMCNISKSILQRYIEEYPEKLTSGASTELSIYHAKVYLDECRLYVDGPRTEDVFNASISAECIKYCTNYGLRRRSSRKRSAVEAL